MTEKKPIFCTDCQHARGEEWGGISCHAFTIEKLTYKGVRFYAPNPEVLNKNCDCKYFVLASSVRRILTSIGQLM